MMMLYALGGGGHWLRDDIGRSGGNALVHDGREHMGGVRGLLCHTQHHPPDFIQRGDR